MAVTFEPWVRMPRTCKIPSTGALASASPDTSTASTVPATANRVAGSSGIITENPAKRRKSSNDFLKLGSASTPLGRHESSRSTVPAFSAQKLPNVPDVALATLARKNYKFLHFFWAMDPDKRDAIIAEIGDGVDGETWWRVNHYHPLYASEPCKIAFLIIAEKYLDQKSIQKAIADYKHEKNKTNKGEGQRPPMSQYGCYRCYTLQPEAAFEANPPHVVVFPCGRLTMYKGENDLPAFQGGAHLLRRYCIECGVRDGLYLDNVLVESMTNQKWWVCKCRRIHWVSPSKSYVECEGCLRKSAFRSVKEEVTVLFPSWGVPLMELGPKEHPTCCSQADIRR
ncbi:hypothetical protein CDEST_01976 [Colletotrichum destructivum]|uniref:Uncharacterized protein n=1 Tax=Colletotrichum destructivum TaxID=34406 RepID=A0AAX4I0N6_9PEZI|nr:hypothetical protein CDEST_01976 [Colletotrichum destructivum]